MTDEITIRPNSDRIFPWLPTPFAGFLALGNGTQFCIKMIRSSDLNMVALHIVGVGMSAFMGKVVPISPKWVLTAFPELLQGDAKNLADFISDQIQHVDPATRLGHYFEDLLQVSP